MVVPIILAGGLGCRLWPLSREAHPKQLLALTSKRTLLQDVLIRWQDMPDVYPPIIVCRAQHRSLVQQQVRELGMDVSAIILEPRSNDTAPAITLGALHAKLHFPDASLLILPSDHDLGDPRVFLKSLAVGRETLAHHPFVIFGIEPTYPETAYGYIKLGKRLSAKAPVFEVKQFIEKPELALAQAYVNDSAFLWNSGLFLFNNDAFLQAQQRYVPNILRSCEQAMFYSRQEGDFIWPQNAALLDCDASSMEYFFTQADNPCVVVQSQLDWCDIGSWDALAKRVNQTQATNVVLGDVWTEQTENCYLHAEHRLLAAVGVDDLIIVETRDAVLVVRKDQSQAVKQLVQQLKRAKRDEAITDDILRYSWGQVQNISKDANTQILRMHINPGASCYLPTYQAVQIWTVVQGQAKFSYQAHHDVIEVGQSFTLPVASMAQVTNRESHELVLVGVTITDLQSEQKSSNKIAGAEE